MMATRKEIIRQIIHNIKSDELYFYNDNRCFDFIRANPENTDELVINEKISAMNNGVIDLRYVPSMATHIHSLHIDEQLNAGDLDIVAQISALIPEDPYKFRLLASKYCNFHFPDIYPVQSPVSEELLTLYIQHVAPTAGLPGDLLPYENFKKVIDHMVGEYDLQPFNYYELEKFLWLRSEPIKKFLKDPDRDDLFSDVSSNNR